MIISHINGGLGNQLFQYAAGRALAEHHKVLFKIDKSYYDRVSHRKFEMDKFNLDLTYATQEEITKATNKNIFKKAVSKLQPPHKKIIFTEPHYNYYDKFFQAPANTFLIGLWQSEKYFNSIADLVRKEFTLTINIADSVRERAAHIQQEQSVSVHIRRGDYENPKVQQHLGLQPHAYYKKALQLLQEKVGEVKAYFFSDDIDFVKKNFDLNIPHEFVSSSETNHYEDFYLMQHCQHNIIANSTFSWWCAWLNANENKVVIAPKKWFVDEANSAPDLIPAKWIKL